MRGSARSAALLVLLVVSACGGAQTKVDLALQRMRDQPRADIYEASGAFADGKVMQTPPAGTIPRERVLGPAPVSPALLEQGRSRFRIFCATCHGIGGFGGSVVGANWSGPRPPSLRVGPAATLPARQVYQVIREGFGRMPSYAGVLTVADRWAIVEYALTLRGRLPADSAEREDSARAVAISRRDSVSAEPLP